MVHDVSADEMLLKVPTPVRHGRWGVEELMPTGVWQPLTVLCGYESREAAEADVAKLAAGGGEFRVYDRRYAE